MSSSCMYLCACHSPRGIAYGRRMTTSERTQILTNIDQCRDVIAEATKLLGVCLQHLEADDLNRAGDADAR